MKKIILIALLICIVFVLASCQIGNRQVGMDTIQTFDRYKIVIGDDVIEGKIQTFTFPVLSFFLSEDIEAI